jgi:hypothetical protein
MQHFADKSRSRASFLQPVFFLDNKKFNLTVEPTWNVMAYGDAWEKKWRGNWRMEWIASTLHTTSEHGVSSITTADTHTSAASSRLNWRPHRFKWTRPFRRKTNSCFCACAVTFQTQSIHSLYNTRKHGVCLVVCFCFQSSERYSITIAL